MSILHNYQTIALGWVILSYIIYRVTTRVILSHRRAVKAREWKCAEPLVLKSKWPLGIDLIRESLKADKAAMFPPLMQERARRAGRQAGLGRPVWTNKFYALGHMGIGTSEPENVKFLLAKGFEDFDLGPVRRGNFFPLLGNGIFTQDGKAWEHSRAMMRPQFARDQVSDLDLEEFHVQNMMKALPVNSDGLTNEVDLQVLFFRLTLDSATEFLFGESVDSQIKELSEQKSASKPDLNFAAAFDAGQFALATRARFGQNYNLCKPKGFKEACDSCHQFIDHFVRLALSKQLRTTSETVSEKTKEKYIFLEALAAETQDPIELRSQLLNILLAGRDTTASLLSWLFLMLALNPHYYQKLRRSIIQDFGTYANCDSSSITFSSLKSSSFLQQCINETLRLYPVVPVNGRRANKDTYLPTGGGISGTEKIFVPKDTSVDYSVFVMHRRTDLWGEDAEVFRPERWEGRKPGWEFLPFNGGPRICIGQQFAVTEASYVTVRLLQRFSAMEDVGNQVRYGLTLTMCTKDGVKVRLREDKQ